MNLPLSLTALVSRAYPSPEWAVFFEVNNATGGGARRRADAIALGIWPSRGHAVIGFEFKEDRRDWLREKQHPEKADVIAQHCDRWYVVAGGKDIVKLDELPEPWGLLVASPSRDRLLTAKPAAAFPDRDTGVIRRSFVASMLRKVTETTVPKAELDRLVDDAVQHAVERTREGHELKHAKQRVEQLEAVMKTFKENTGVDMGSWRGPQRIAAAVAAVCAGNSYREQLERAKKQLETAADQIGDALKEWPALVDDKEAAV